MKKISGVYMAVNAVIVVLVPFICSIKLGLFKEGVLLSNAIIVTLVFVALFGCIYFMVIMHIAGSLIARHTFDKLEEDSYDYTFSSDSSVLAIDTENGRLAYVSEYNPFKLQIASADGLSNVHTYVYKTILNGTRRVDFRFNYKEKKYKIPAFTSRTTYNLQSTTVLTAISKADTYVEALLTAKQNAVNEMN